ncbi:MAG: hypothetical protein RR199_07065 [Alistipes sp.]
MIRILFLSLLSLTLSCGNTRPEPTLAVAEQTAPVVAQTVPTTPVAEAAETVAAKPAPRSKRSKTTQPAAKLRPAKKQIAAPEVVAVPEATSPEVVAEPEVAAPSEAPTAQTSDLQTPIETTSVAVETPATAVDTLVTAAPALAASSTAKEVKKHFLPTRRRMDREINKNKFAYKGEVMMGLTASYGTLSSDDTDIMLIIDNINADGTVATVKPFVGYFYSDNHCIGVRFGYRHLGGTVNRADIDLGESNDIQLDIPYLDLKSNNYSFGVFHRSYAGLDPKGRFGLFAEFELSLSTGSSNFAYESGDVIKRTFSDNTQLKLAFNPGAAVYIFPNVCATLSFGLGGIQYTSVTQKDAAGNKIGTRKSSNMKFKLNIAAINFGMTIHLWDKKKK